jgi:hypothetical protein
MWKSHELSHVLHQGILLLLELPEIIIVALDGCDQGLYGLFGSIPSRFALFSLKELGLGLWRWFQGFLGEIFRSVLAIGHFLDELSLYSSSQNPNSFLAVYLREITLFCRFNFCFLEPVILLCNFAVSRDRCEIVEAGTVKRALNVGDGCHTNYFVHESLGGQQRFDFLLYLCLIERKLWFLNLDQVSVIKDWMHKLHKNLKLTLLYAVVLHKDQLNTRLSADPEPTRHCWKHFSNAIISKNTFL